MSSLTVQCPECSLRLADIEHPDVAYERDGDGNILCPNDRAPMKPIGAGKVLNAEEAFAQANRELVPDAPLPAGETTETLTKRLREIESARGRVVDAQDRYNSKHSAAKEAKKHLDDETESFLAIVGRLSSVPAALPLFTQEAEAAAAVDKDVDASIDAWRDPQAIYDALMDAGYLAASLETITAWTNVERDQARGWASIAGTVESMPAFMAKLVENETTTA